MTVLSIRAGKTAYRFIKENGLRPSDIACVFGASGAAKWLAIYGLDAVIFSHWLNRSPTPVHLFGTSIGAWKFAAAAQENSGEALDRLKHAYIHQYYEGRVTARQITAESRRIMGAFLADDGIEGILSHPVYRIGFSAVRCRGLLASARKPLQILGMVSAFELNLLSRKLQHYCYERVLFHDPRYDSALFDLADFPTRPVILDRRNFRNALLASGSIPLVMEGVTGIDGAPKGTYRDGGLLDYHPVLQPASGTRGLILYPHFYPEITPGWFDKKFPRRRAVSRQLDRMIILCPSPDFIAHLPFKRIPDRKDFIRFKARDDDRVKAWETAADMSRRLGGEFLEMVDSGRIKDQVQRI